MPDGRIVALSESAISMISEMGEEALGSQAIGEEISAENENDNNPVIVSTKDLGQSTILVSGASVETLLLNNVNETEDVSIAVEESSGTFKKSDELNLEDFVEVITTFKCKACDFTSNDRQTLLVHIGDRHFRNNVEDQDDTEENADNANSIPSRFDSVSLDSNKVTITKKISDPNLGTHYRIFVQNENREMFVCGQCSGCFESEQKIQEHLGQLSCFTPICPHCDTDFSGSVSNRISYLRHTETCNKDTIAKKCGIVDFKQTPVETDGTKNNELESEELPDSLPQGIKSDSDRSMSAVERRKKIRELEADHHKRALECPVKSCTFMFKEVDKLRYHTSCHTEDSSNFKCIECEKKFEKWRDLATHLWKEHLLDCDMLLCGHCRNYRTMYPKILESHNQTHQNLKQYKC